MSTNDVPGFDPKNADTLAAGCWAENAGKDSLLRVEDTENDRVIFSLYDLTRKPVTRYTFVLPVQEFNERFSWSAKDRKGRLWGKRAGAAPQVVWDWHDKQRFPWDRVIDAGLSDAPGYASVMDQLSDAMRTIESLRRSGVMPESGPEAVDPSDLQHLVDMVTRHPQSRDIADKIQQAIKNLPPGRS